MKELFKNINKHTHTKLLTAIELFGRTGEWHTTQYMDQVKSLEIWELQNVYLEHLKKNCPTAKIKILDTVYNLKFGKLDKYDIIVIDAPNSTFGTNDGIFTDVYCEHFDILPLIHKLIDRNAIVIFNVIKDDHPDIQHLQRQARKAYYKGNTDYITFYHDLFRDLGYEINWYYTHKRNQFVYYYCFSLTKI